ncbi:VirB5 family type IV secretion complex minor pilin [Hafnia paralvei ATCC 29927]|uniref:type IV secretion system protein n=1 Tax=Hafnia paralvei TaxID=546367 RepID=UPI0007E2F00B|nr:type IV secretion system protein [Hafnia paralvei]OAT35733.1 VirB5 family type IV secretion complex minor pilin [Hafnia paralvei ATCC 29927]
MRRKLLSVFIACYFTAPLIANATGIPVFDAGSIMQMVQNATETAQQAADQLNQLKDQYNQAVAAAEAEKARFEGNWSLGDILNDPTLTSYLPDNWTDIYSSGDVSGLRDQYQLKSSNPEVQEQYDSLLSNLNTMQEAYDSTVQRTKNIEQLASYMNSAQTPQQKSDYANRILFEQTQIQNEQAKVNAVKTMMEQREHIQNKARAQSWIDEFRSK